MRARAARRLPLIFRCNYSSTRIQNSLTVLHVSSGKVGEGGSEQDGVSEQGAVFRLHTVEQLPSLYAVSTRVNV